LSGGHWGAAGWAIALPCALWWARAAWLGLLADRRLEDLGETVPVPPRGAWPPLAAVVAARDEAGGIDRAIRSLVSQDYPALEVIAVDDRSRDGTGEILDRLSGEFPNLRVVHVRALPHGWLGKNHACARGAEEAAGRWILFTDGDVVFAPTALRRAVAYAEARDLGHLAALPHLVAPRLLERAFVTTFASFANMAFRTWELRRPKTAGFVGIGAFNLVLRDAYRTVGGHGRLPLEAVDDVKLGMVLRRSGVRQGAVRAGRLVSVRWNAGFVASWRGLLKNAFAAAEYRWPVALAAAFALCLLGAGPWAVLLLGSGASRAIALCAVALSTGVVGGASRRVVGGSGVEALLLPLAAPALASAVLASAALATARGSVTWRGTRYPLKALRQGCVRVRDWPPDGAVGWDRRWW